MRVVFMGTPAFAATVLEHILDSQHEVAGVFTRPDAVRSRGKKLVASEVKACAVAHGVPVFEYSSLRSDEAFDALSDFDPDVVCVAAYGAILPKRVLDLPRFGCLNVHGSLLPRWRGAAPVERAILAGDEATGIGIMRMEEGLDTGATAKVCTVQTAGMSASQLSGELARVGGAALVETLDALGEGRALTWVEQPAEGITYAEKLSKHELDVDPSLDSLTVERRVLASSEGHACRCVIAGKSVTLERVECIEGEAPSVGPGKAVFSSKRLFIGCSDGVVEVFSLKPDGKKSMDALSFASGIQGIKQGNIDWRGIE